MGRRLGQHFLTDPAILDRIVEASNATPEDIALEIGAGRGSLTRRLAARVRHVVAIERDSKLAERLLTDFESERGRVGGEVTVVQGDALALDWHGLLAGAGGATAGFSVIGNIPYYITSPLIEKALTPPLPRAIVFLVQEEVARRLGSAPGSSDYGALTVGVGSVARAETLFRVRAGSFRPPPEVDSAVVRLTPLADPLVSAEDRPAFRRMVSRLFSQRRKQLGRSTRDVFDLSRERALSLLRAAGLDSGVRPEVLSPQQFVRLYEAAALTREPGDA